VRPSKLAVVLGVALVVLTVAGTRLGLAATPYVVLGAVFVTIALAAKIPERDHIVYLGSLSLSLIWMVTLLGAHVLGPDMNLEYRVSGAIMQDGWNWSGTHQYATSIVVALLAPWLSSIPGVELLWVYKAIFPAILAIVPVVLYMVYKEVWGGERAFWSVLFFLTVPVLTLEVVGIGKMMVACLFLALMFLVLVKAKWNIWVKGATLGVLTTLALLSHYTVGGIGLAIIGVAILSIVLMRVIGGIVSPRTDWKGAIVPLSIAALLTISVGYMYFSRIGEGRLLEFATDLVGQRTTAGASLPMLLAAFGLDIHEVPLAGKVFRIAQLLTQGMMAVGLVALWRKRREVPAEYLGCMAGGGAALSSVLLLSHFAEAVNVTRIYFVGLFVLAPLIVLGVQMTGVHWRKLLAMLLIVYFACTSGLVFELGRSEVTSRLETPYSFALSYERVGVIGVHDRNTLEAARWVMLNTNTDTPVVSDALAGQLLGSVDDNWHPSFDNPFHNRIYPKWELGTPYPQQWSLWKTPDTGSFYVFLTSWNVKHWKAVQLVPGVIDERGYEGAYIPGMRDLRALPANLLDNEIVYQSGKATVLLVINSQIEKGGAK